MAPFAAPLTTGVNDELSPVLLLHSPPIGELSLMPAHGRANGGRLGDAPPGYFTAHGLGVSFLATDADPVQAGNLLRTPRGTLDLLEAPETFTTPYHRIVSAQTGRLPDGRFFLEYGAVVDGERRKHYLGGAGWDHPTLERLARVTFLQRFRFEFYSLMTAFLVAFVPARTRKPLVDTIVEAWKRGNAWPPGFFEPARKAIRSSRPPDTDITLDMLILDIYMHLERLRPVVPEDEMWKHVEKLRQRGYRPICYACHQATLNPDGICERCKVSAWQAEEVR